MKNKILKSILITGAAQGIGKAIAQRFLIEGWRVAFTDVDRQAGRETVKEFSALGEVIFLASNNALEKDVRQSIATVVQQWGSLNALVNNAGFLIKKAPEHLSIAEWRQVIDTNLTGAFLNAKYCIPHLRKTQGAILNIASTRALMSEPHTESYTASKGGLVSLTHALALSLGPDVRVHCISPGWIDVSAWKKSSKRHQATLSAQDHKQHPAGRVGRPEDIASLAFFLLAQRDSFLTGENFVVDGGMTRKMIYV